MLIDSRELPEAARIEADVCVIGSGPAGVTVAKELAESGADVALLESGGLTLDPATQDLYRGELAGREYGALEGVRMRVLGGSSNHWTGYVRALRDTDFVRKDWLPDSGWPITEADMRPYYARAKEIFGLGTASLDGEDWVSKLDLPFVDFNRDTIRHGVAILKPMRFGAYARDQLSALPNVRLYLYANVTRIQSNPDGTSVDSLRVETLTGRRLLANARHYVLACGGLENPRIMLASNDVEANGLGNSHGVVGRYFMEHLYAADAGLVYTDFATSRRLTTVYGSGHETSDGLEVYPHVEIADGHKAARRTHGLLVKIRRFKRSVDGIRALREMLEDIRNRSSAATVLARLKDAVVNIDDLSILAADRVFGSSPDNKLVATAEQSPNSASRVRLHETERDALDMPRAVLDWRVQDDDFESMRAGMETVGAEFGRLGLGRVQSQLLSDDGAWRENLFWAYHHLGTTRMGDSPQNSVVDRDCRVHGKANLYVAGSSVFPTGGTATPTFTIVALAIRIADTIAARLQRGVRS